MEKNYTIVDKWLDLGKENVVNVKSVDGVIEGGGGGGDFKIVNITVVNNLSDAVNFFAPVYSDTFNSTGYFENIQDGETKEFKCVIPNDGNCSGTFEDSLRNPIPKRKISKTGDVIIDEFGNITITGDAAFELHD